MADKAKIDELFNLFDKVIDASDNLIPHLKGEQLTEVVNTVAFFNDVRNDPESRPGLEKYSDDVIDEGIRLGRNALRDMEMNLTLVEIHRKSPILASLIQR
jgi:hypothetical protein